MEFLCGIAINRFGYTPNQFYRLSPLEFHEALKDYNDIQDIYFGWVKLICQVLRLIAVNIYNSAFGRKEKDVIQNPSNLIKFSWEKPKVQTVDEMKEVILGLAHHSGIKVTQKGEEIKGI